MGFSRRNFAKMRPAKLVIEKENSGSKNVDFSSLIKEMKSYCQSSLLPGVKKHATPKPNSLYYIFAQPSVSVKSPKERSVNEFLTEMGIFQINTCVVMKEYAFK